MKTASPEERHEILKKAGFTDEEIEQMKQFAWRRWRRRRRGSAWRRWLGGPGGGGFGGPPAAVEGTNRGFQLE